MSDTQNNLPPADGDKPQEQNERVKDQASAEGKPADEATSGPEASATDANAPESEPPQEQPETPSAEKQDEHLSDEELEGDDTTEEVEGEEDEHDKEHPDELELPDYAEFEPAKLVSEADKLLREQPVQKIKEHIEAIRKHLLNHLNEERAQKLKEFIDQGGNEIDFEYVQPLREKFRSIFSDYRKKRKKHYDDLRAQLDSNLKIKKELIERLREIVTKDESIGHTFKEFNEILQEWRNTGPVPRSESNNLWKTYHHHVENFYEYIKINKELRDLDYKKNREAKEELLGKAEALSKSENVSQAFKDLQKLHKDWKHIGPVEPENREPLWEKFSDFTKQIHDKREQYFQELREKRGELIEEKKKLVDKIAAVSTKHSKHHEWQKAMKEVNALSEAFKKIGRLNHPENDAVWERYREVVRNFNHEKNDFYKNLKKEHQANLEKKQALLQRAEELKDSDDWRNTANELKRIQADWKKIGHVPKKDSDKIWKQFRGACNHFFERLTQHNKKQDEKLEGNLELKKEILGELEALETNPDDRKGTVAKIKEIIGKWRDAGQVPRGKGKIEKTFNSVLDQKFEAVDMDRQESIRIRFENKVKSMAQSGGDHKLKKERSALRQKIEEAKRELGQLQTNMSFFSSSNPNSPIVKEAKNKIKQQEELVERQEEQLKMLNVKIRELGREAEKAEEAEQSANDDNAPNG